MTHELTDLQAKVMNWIAYNYMTPVNGTEPEIVDDANCFLWVDEIADDLSITEAQAKGAVGSLKARDYVYIAPYDGDNIIGFTQTGFDAWQKVKTGH